jgi:ubiquinone/menaquinone biosynthesis C-methylase UbiE
MGNKEVKRAWGKYWTHNRDKELSLDEMSETIITEILKNSGDVKGKRILEAGCGRGIISARLAEYGAEVYLLDFSPDAIQIAKKHFTAKNLSASFILGNILDLPFKESAFDIVWNAGVMEHFEDDLQLVALRDITQIIRHNGLFITFNPYEGAFFYNIGKKFAEQKRKWPYGPEFPIKSLNRKCKSTGLTVLEEYQICFKENLSYLSYVSKHLRSIIKIIFSPFSKKLLIRIFGGYLLVTIAIKQQR